MVYQAENIRNIYKYIGSLGIIADEELQDIYWMRDRHYDAMHGRFISMDPIGDYFYYDYYYGMIKYQF